METIDINESQMLFDFDNAHNKCFVNENFFTAMFFSTISVCFTVSVTAFAIIFSTEIIMGLHILEKMRTCVVLIFIVVGAVYSADVYNFFFVNCAHIQVKPSSSYNTLKEALGNCTLTSCNGVQKISDNNYSMFYYVFYKTEDSTAAYPETYLLDRTADEPVLSKAPDSIYAKMIYNIYSGGSCPNLMKVVDSMCTFKSQQPIYTRRITEDECNSYPADMKAEYNSTSGCSFVPKETIVAAWT